MDFQHPRIHGLCVFTHRGNVCAEHKHTTVGVHVLNKLKDSLFESHRTLLQYSLASAIRRRRRLSASSIEASRHHEQSFSLMGYSSPSMQINSGSNFWK